MVERACLNGIQGLCGRQGCYAVIREGAWGPKASWNWTIDLLRDSWSERVSGPDT